MRDFLSSVSLKTKGTGEVHIVGAGPGDAELLTLKALRLLRTADLVVHDRLVSPEVLELIPAKTRRIDVGKARGRHPTPQGGIIDILIAEARQGLTVVRLKGGDPFVFGRGGEELEALRAAGVAADVTPGISAALGCAASAGLPLTHRDHAHAVTFVTGRGKTGSQAPDLTGLAGPGRTLAVYMGRDCAAAIAEQLLRQGVDASTPVAVIENGTLPGERILKGALSDLAEIALETDPEAPALLFVGETAALATPASLSQRERAFRAPELATPAVVRAEGEGSEVPHPPVRLRRSGPILLPRGEGSETEAAA